MTGYLVDEMMLLTSTEDGRHALRDLPLLVAGAALADLALTGRVSCPGRTVAVEDDASTGHPVLDDLLARIGATRRGRTPWRWVFDSARPVTREVRRHLSDTGVLEPRQDAVLGMLPRTRTPVADQAARSAIVDRVRALVLADDVTTATGHAEPGTLMLVSLLSTAYHSRRTAAELFPELDAKELRTRLRDVAQSHWVVSGTAQAVRLSNAARG